MLIDFNMMYFRIIYYWMVFLLPGSGYSSGQEFTEEDGNRLTYSSSVLLRVAPGFAGSFTMKFEPRPTSLFTSIVPPWL